MKSEQLAVIVFCSGIASVTAGAWISCGPGMALFVFGAIALISGLAGIVCAAGQCDRPAITSQKPRPETESPPPGPIASKEPPERACRCRVPRGYTGPYD